MTNTWADIKNADLIVIMGGNAAEAHPCGFKWVTEAKHHNHAKLIVVDPALHPFRGDGRPLHADPLRHRHRVARRGDQL